MRRLNVDRMRRYVRRHHAHSWRMGSSFAEGYGPGGHRPSSWTEFHCEGCGADRRVYTVDGGFVAAENGVWLPGVHPAAEDWLRAS